MSLGWENECRIVELKMSSHEYRLPLSAMKGSSKKYLMRLALAGSLSFLGFAEPQARQGVCCHCTENLIRTAASHDRPQRQGHFARSHL